MKCEGEGDGVADCRGVEAEVEEISLPPQNQPPKINFVRLKMIPSNGCYLTRISK
jgi:hypothetical protein